jgi:hypothetical protein
MALLRLYGLLVVSCVLVGATTLDLRAAAAEGDRLDEHHVKAAFLFNFAKFIQWPTSDRSETLVVGVLGQNPFNEVLEAVVTGKSVNGREVVVRQLRNEDDVRAFHIIFIAASEARRGARILERVGGASVLTVGETPQFLREGGIVQFYVRENRVRFDINSAGANQAGLRISSQLLSLAKQ